MEWSPVQVQAAGTLEVFLGLTDLHLLHKSILELLDVIVAYPITARAQTLHGEQARAYIETTVKVYLHFTLEFADVVIASTEAPGSAHILVNFIERLRMLADPFPERETVSLTEISFSRNAIAAFSEIAVSANQSINQSINRTLYR